MFRIGIEEKADREIRKTYQVFIILGLVLLSLSIVLQAQLYAPDSLSFMILIDNANESPYTTMLLGMIFLGLADSLVSLGSHQYFVNGAHLLQSSQEEDDEK